MRNLLLMMVFAFAAVGSIAQRRTAELGLKAGVNIANFNDDVSGRDARVGFHGGLLVHVHVRPNLAIQPEIVYSQQGAEFSTGKQKVDYINIPFLIQYLFKSGFRLQTGPQIGFLTSAEFKTNNGLEVDTDDNFKKTDGAWVIGLSYLSSSRLGVDARYNIGLSDITKGGQDVMNRVWQIGMFYQFRP